jgi:hypothetical protein
MPFHVEGILCVRMGVELREGLEFRVVEEIAFKQIQFISLHIFIFTRELIERTLSNIRKRITTTKRMKERQLL